MNKLFPTDQSFLDNLYTTIEDNLLNEQFGVEELAREIGISRTQLHRRLNTLTGQSTSQLIREYRLSKAKELLEKESATVAEVSYQVGFGSPSYFNTCFAELYGYPPGEVKFRNSVKSKRKPLITVKIALLIASIFAVLALIYLSANRYITSEKNKNPVTLEKSIAVMAFDDMSPTQDQEYLGDGIAEEIINTLAKFEGLKVIARTSSFQFKGKQVDLREVGRELQVNSILEGSVICANDKIRITAQLIDVRDGTHIWSDQFDYNMIDHFTILDGVAEAISSKFQLALSVRETPKNITTEAWDRYFKGTYQMTDLVSHRSYEIAIKYFQEAIKIDPEFAAAYSSLAAAYIELTGWNGNKPPSEEYRVKCQDAAKKAIKLDPDQAEAYNVLGRIVWRFENDWNKANTYFKKGMELKPTASWAYVEYMNFLTWMGDFDKSIALGKELIEMDPLSNYAPFELAWSYYVAKRDQEFIDLCMKMIAIDPDVFWAKLMLASYYTDQKEFEKAAHYAGITDSTKITIDTHPWELMAFGTYYGYSGDTAKAEECLKILHQQRQGMSVYSAESYWIYISMGKYDETLSILEEGFNLDIKPAHLVTLKTHPVFDPLRDNPRFIRLLDKMKFDEYKME